jgi:hypothetical protein
MNHPPLLVCPGRDDPRRQWRRNRRDPHDRGGRPEQREEPAGDAGVWRGQEWQWQGGSGTSRKRRSVRFEWYRLESGSGSIGRDMDSEKKGSIDRDMD